MASAPLEVPVPPPAATTSIITDVGGPNLVQAFAWAFVRGTPPWFVSFILHVLGLITLGLMVFHEQTPMAATLVVRQVPPADVEEFVYHEIPETTQVEALELDALIATSDTAESVDAVPAANFRTDALHLDIVDASVAKPLPSEQALMFAVPLNRPTRPSDNAKPAGDQAEMQMALAAERGEAAFGEALNDQIVYRFILWDIGRLQGVEGTAARQAFEGLTIDALPSLIRGLNASAYMSASCPVIVLSSKVETLVTQSQNPEKYRFALENIGRGVDPNARYATNLMNLRQRLGQQAAGGGPNQNFDDSDRQRRADYVRHLARARVAQLRKALENDDADMRWAAVQVIAARGILIPEHIIPLLDDEVELVRQQAHVTLVRLARGADLGPELGANEEQVAEAMDAWRDWWRQNRNRPAVSEYRPEELEAEGRQPPRGS